MFISILDKNKKTLISKFLFITYIEDMLYIKFRKNYFFPFFFLMISST
jgi:hypothetical protein